MRLYLIECGKNSPTGDRLIFVDQGMIPIDPAVLVRELGKRLCPNPENRAAWIQRARVKELPQATSLGSPAKSFNDLYRLDLDVVIDVKGVYCPKRRRRKRNEQD